MEVVNETYNFFEYINILQRNATDIRDSLEEFKNDFKALQFDDSFSQECKDELNEHIKSMNVVLEELYSTIDALRYMHEVAEYYTGYGR